MTGALLTLDLAWSIIDLCMAMITICNLIAIIFLFPKVKFLVDDYLSQKKEGKDPVFKKFMMSRIEKDLDAWE